MDGIPVFSQAKSLYQLARKQPERALETQKIFSRKCPVISQIRSAVEAGVLDDKKAALETQKECGRFVGGIVNGIPLVGHVKGAVHYACGDSEGGLSAMKAASRSTVVVAKVAAAAVEVAAGLEESDS